MKRKISHFKLGLFALLGAGIGFGALIWVGAASFFEKTTTYAIFFDTSVEGLQKGAAVSYRGVKVGEVSSIGIGPDDRFIEVLVSIDNRFKVDQSMVAQLSQQGLTGQGYISLQRLAKGEKAEKPQLPYQVNYPIIPGRPSEMSRIEETVKDVMDKVKQMDLGQLAQNWAETARNLSAALASGDIAQTLDNIHAASSDLRTILQGLSGTGRPQQWGRVFQDIAATADALRTSTAKLSEQLKALPPDVFANLANRMEKMVTTGEKAVSSWDRQVDQSLALIEKSVVDVNRLLADLEGLIQSLRENPGQILQQPRSSEPFAR